MHDPRIQVKGHIDLIVRNQDGTVDQAQSKSNLITDCMKLLHLIGVTQIAADVVISAEVGAMDPHRTITVWPTTDINKMNTTRILDAPNKTWTFSVVFSAPANTRTVKMVCLSESGSSGTSASMRLSSSILAGTTLTTPITQTTTQTLEISYKLAFSRV